MARERAQNCQHGHSRRRRTFHSMRSSNPISSAGCEHPRLFASRKKNSKAGNKIGRKSAEIVLALCSASPCGMDCGYLERFEQETRVCDSLLSRGPRIVVFCVLDCRNTWLAHLPEVCLCPSIGTLAAVGRRPLNGKPTRTTLLWAKEPSYDSCRSLT